MLGCLELCVLTRHVPADKYGGTASSLDLGGRGCRHLGCVGVLMAIPTGAGP